MVTIRPPEQGESAALVAGRDAEWARWLGPGDVDPHPTACIVVADEIVGWIDGDPEPEWLPPRAVNIGFNLFPSHRGKGYASRALQLLMHRLALEGECDTATLLVEPRNTASLAVAARSRFAACGARGGERYFVSPVPRLTYTDGTRTIRRQHPDDLEADLATKDDEQINSFGSGPKWTFAIDAGGVRAIGHVDCDLASANVPAGEANVSYSAHPAHRGKGHVSASVRLLFQFLIEHTATRAAHFVIDPSNVASLRVAAAVGAIDADRFVDGTGKQWARYVHTL